MENMTELTQMMFDSATSISTVGQAVQVLLETGCFRTLGDILRSYAGTNDPKSMLVDGWMGIHPTENRDSVDKKIRNWLGGRTNSISKEDGFQISLLLQLTLEQTDAFLKQACGEGIHWRDPRDILWSYGILHQKSYAQIQALLERYHSIPKSTVPGEAPKAFTAEVRARLEPLLSQSQDALLDWLCREQPSLGSFHNTAYHLFDQYMRLLETGGQSEEQLQEAREKSRKSEFDEEAFAALLRQSGKSETEIRTLLTQKKHEGFDDRITSRDILEVYLYRNLVPVSKRGAPKEKNLFSNIQNNLRGNWPDETAISKMKKRQLDVTRKVLILLFLATNGSGSAFEEDDEDELLETRDEIFQDIYSRLNLMLKSCGFPMLDPRNPFDWLVLFCICVDDTWEVDRRLADMLTAMFPARNEKQES